MRLSLPGHISDHVLLRTGQMLIVGPKTEMLPEAADVDLQRLLKTCQLLTDFPQLPQQELLTKAALKQSRSKKRGGFADTNLVIFGRGTLVSQVDPKSANAKSNQTVATN